MTNPKHVDIFNKTFLLDIDKHPVGISVIRKLPNRYGGHMLIESKILAYSPSGTAVLLSNIPDLTEAPVSAIWYETEEVSKTIFDILMNVEETPKEEPEKTKMIRSDGFLWNLTIPDAVINNLSIKKE